MPTMTTSTSMTAIAEPAHHGAQLRSRADQAPQHRRQHNRRSEMRFSELPGNSRSRRWLACLLMVALFAVGIPQPSSAADDAQALLATSATAMGALQSFHFVITI